MHSATFYRLLLFLLILLPSATFAVEQKKPNILFILTDDQRWDSVGCYGNKSIRTPNLDRLAAEGARLDSFYVAAPLCCPSRATFLTGLYPHQTGINTNKPADIPAGTRTVAHHLNEAGYVTGYIGKTHLGNDPKKWGFKHCPVFETTGKSRHKDPILFYRGKVQPVQGMITTIFANEAIKFLRDHQKETWFLWLATTAPHAPFIWEPEYRYDQTKISPPPGWPPGASFDSSKWARYYATVTMLDHEIGRVFAELQKLGLAGNTFVMMASDNGHMFGSHGQQDKMSWYEGSSRVPAIVRWPGQIQSSSKVKSVLSSVDLLPTLLDLAGLPALKTLDAFSMIPALKNLKPLRSSTFSEIGNWQMVRQGPWKLVRLAEDGKNHRLYNIEKDPLEMNDLIGKEGYGEIIFQLEQEIAEWKQRTRPVPNAKGVRKTNNPQDPPGEESEE